MNRRSTAAYVFAAAGAMLGAMLGAAQGPAAAAPAGTTVSGVVYTLAADTVDHSANPQVFRGHSEDVYRQVLVVGDKSYFLKGEHVRANSRVRATGAISGSVFTASSITRTDTVAGIADAGTTRVLVMLAYWVSPDGTTQASAANQMFADTNGWYRDASYGALGQTGDVTPWLKIAGPTTGCYADHLTLMSQAKTAASAAGYAVNTYDNYVLYFPYCAGDSGGYAGWAYVGSQGTWLNGYMDRRVSVHEQGHNYGLWHSHSYMCDGGGLLGTCSFSDYGDLYDAMGSSGYVGHFNASQKSILGWMGGRTVDLTAGGTATLVPMSSDGTNPHAAVVAVGTGRKYWIEYRRPLDYDSSLPPDGTDGVLVHVSGPGSGSPDSGASLIDVRPGDGTSPYTATLRSGQSWTSPDGITIAVGSVTSAAATVTVRNAAYVKALMVSKSGTGTGSVASQPGGISCGAVCSSDFAVNSTVTLTAAPSGGSTFAGWSGACSGTSTTCSVAMSSDQAATARFDQASTRYEEAAATFTGWKPFTDATVGPMRSHTVSGSTAQFKFSGPAAQWLTKMGPGQGKASVTIDGASKGTFDLYSATAQGAAISFSGLGAGSHTLVIKVLGTKNASATGTQVVVRGFTVGTTAFNQDANAIMYQKWKGASAATASGGSYRSSGTANATATLSFTGTGIDWVTATGPGWGRAQVTIDGIVKGVVDLYAATAHPQTLKSYLGLPAGTHTLTITALGTKNAAATATNVEVDGFIVH